MPELTPESDSTNGKAKKKTKNMDIRIFKNKKYNWEST
jgi:hypothetical protein